MGTAISAALSNCCSVQLLRAEQTTRATHKVRNGKKIRENYGPLTRYNRWLGVQGDHDSLCRNYSISVAPPPQTNSQERKGYYSNVRGSINRLGEGRTGDL